MRSEHFRFLAIDIQKKRKKEREKAQSEPCAMRGEDEHFPGLQVISNSSTRTRPDDYCSCHGTHSIVKRKLAVKRSPSNLSAAKTAINIASKPATVKAKLGLFMRR